MIPTVFELFYLVPEGLMVGRIFRRNAQNVPKERLVWLQLNLYPSNVPMTQ